MSQYRSNPIEMGGSTVRFYVTYLDAHTVAHSLGRSLGGAFRAVHVTPFGYIIEDREGALLDREGRLPEVTARLVRQRIKVPA